MEKGPPPLPQNKPPFVSFAGALGLLLVVAAAVIACWLFAEPETLSPGVRVVLALGSATLALLAGCSSFISDRRSAMARVVFTVTLLIAVGAVILDVQAASAPAMDFYRAVTLSARSRRNADGAVVIAGAPIPQAPATLTWQDIEPLHRSWIEEKTRAEYEAHGSHDPRWDAVARQFVGAALSERLRLREAPGGSQIRAWARELEAAGCNDPLVTSELARQKPKSQQASLFRQAAKGLKARGYAPALSFLTETELWAISKGKPAEAKMLAREAVEALKLEFSRAPMSDRDCWVWSSLLREGNGSELLDAEGDAVLAAIDQLPTVEPWFKQQLRGKIEIAKAWQARSVGYANEVTASGWSGFNEHLKLARQALTSSWTAHPQHPQAAVMMITVAMGDSETPAREMRLWFDRAVTARLDERFAYQSMLWGLRPRWHGSEEAMLAFGKACAETRRYDTAVPWQYFIATRDAAEDSNDTDAFYTESAPYAELRALCLAYAAAPKAPEPPAFYLSHLVCLAAACEQRPDVLETLERLHFKLQPEVRTTWKHSSDEWPGSYLVETGELAEQEAEAAARAQTGAFADAAALFQAAGAAPKLDPASKLYLERRARFWAGLTPIENAPWETYFPPTGGSEEAKKAGWITVRGRWTRPDANTLELASDHDTETLLHANIAPTAIYEIRGEIVHAARAETSDAALTFGPSEKGHAEWMSVRFRRAAEENTILFSHGLGSEESFHFYPENGPLKFIVRVENRRISASVNGEQVLEAEYDGPHGAENLPAGVGFAVPRSASPQKVQFRNVEWRRLPQAPQPEPAAPSRA